MFPDRLNVDHRIAGPSPLHRALRVGSVALMAVGFWGTVSLVHIGRRLSAHGPGAPVEYVQGCRSAFAPPMHPHLRYGHARFPQRARHGERRTRLDRYHGQVLELDTRIELSQGRPPLIAGPAVPGR